MNQSTLTWEGDSTIRHLHDDGKPTYYFVEFVSGYWTAVHEDIDVSLSLNDCGFLSTAQRTAETAYLAAKKAGEAS